MVLGGDEVDQPHRHHLTLILRGCGHAGSKNNSMSTSNLNFGFYKIMTNLGTALENGRASQKGIEQF